MTHTDTRTALAGLFRQAALAAFPELGDIAIAQHDRLDIVGASKVTPARSTVSCPTPTAGR